MYFSPIEENITRVPFILSREKNIYMYIIFCYMNYSF